MKKTICIYHANCADGFGAAWVVRMALGDTVDFYPGVYQQEPPDVSGMDVIFVDFSYKRDVVKAMRSMARSILVIDHHKSAIENLSVKEEGFTPVDLTQFTGLSDWTRLINNVCQDEFENVTSTVYTYFDNNRSGAMLAWDFFFPGEQPPQLLRHIQDRDLWKFELEGTREIQANVFSYPYDFEVWDELMSTDIHKLAEDGKAIERKHFKDVHELLSVTTRMMAIGGYTVPVSNLPYIFVSDAAHKLAENHPFAGCYWDTPNGRVFGLRSTEHGIDVSDIAIQYGGGGHKHAAGFSVSFDKAMEFEIC